MKQKVTILTAVLMATSLLASRAWAYCDFSAVAPSGQTLYYNLVDGAAEVIYPGIFYSGYTKPSGHVVIPDSVTYNGTTLAVTVIGGSAFFQCSDITSVTIPNTVKIIGGWAFSECTSLTSVTLPNSLEILYGYVFRNCTGLTSLTFNADSCIFIFADGNTSSFTFAGCTNFSNITFGDNVKCIPDYLCYGCSGLTSVTIPNSVSRIGNSAFSGCTGIMEINSMATTAPLLGTNSFYGVSQSTSVIIPCGSQASYAQRWPYFSNYVDGSGASLNAISSDGTMGQTYILQQPTCQNPTAVVYAMPAHNYRFDHWNDGNTDNPRTIELTSNTTIVAIFTPDTSSDFTVHDTIYTAIHDTVFFAMHDSVIVNNYYHDTIFVNNYVYDTVFRYFNHYNHDTTFINNYVHDTLVQYVNHYIHDTTFVNNYVHDTLVQYVNHYVHDTTFVNNYIHDTITINTQIFDTTIVNLYQFDTMISHFYQNDTIIYNSFIYDTVINNLYQYDTVIVGTYIYDTLYLNRWLHDTIYIHDTVYAPQEGINDVRSINARIFQQDGNIVVEGAEGMPVTVYDATGRRIAAAGRDARVPGIAGKEVSIPVPATGVYLVKIGDAPAHRIVVIR